MAEPLPENGMNPAIKNVAVSVFLFIFAGVNQQRKNVYTDNPYQ
jgi:hypothetical protein